MGARSSNVNAHFSLHIVQEGVGEGGCARMVFYLSDLCVDLYHPAFSPMSLSIFPEIRV